MGGRRGVVHCWCGLRYSFRQDKWLINENRFWVCCNYSYGDSTLLTACYRNCFAFLQRGATSLQSFVFADSRWTNRSAHLSSFAKLLIEKAVRVSKHVAEWRRRRRLCSKLWQIVETSFAQVLNYAKRMEKFQKSSEKRSRSTEVIKQCRSLGRTRRRVTQMSRRYVRVSWI